MLERWQRSRSIRRERRSYRITVNDRCSDEELERFVGSNRVVIVVYIHQRA